VKGTQSKRRGKQNIVLVQEFICSAEILLLRVEVVNQVQSKVMLVRYIDCYEPNNKAFYSSSTYFMAVTTGSISNEVTTQTAEVIPLARVIAVMYVSVWL